MTYRPLALTVLTVALALTACNSQKTDAPGAPGAAAKDSKTALPSGPVATVNGEAISSELFEFYAKNRAGRAVADLKPEQRQELLDQLIGLEVAAQAAAQHGLDKQPDTISRLALTRLNVLADAEVAKKFADYRPTEQELRAEYETQIAAMPGTEYKARHILVATEPFAQTLIDKLKAGGNFEEIAKKESMDSSKERGGDLGWFNPARMVPEFSKALAAMKKGEITSKPVKSEFGYHVIKLEDTRPVSPPDFDQVKERLAPVVQQKKVQAYVEELKKGMKVEKKI